MLTAAIIGCGRVVQVGHVLGFGATQDRIKVVALSDPVVENLEIVGAALGVPEQKRFIDYRNMLDVVDCDFVDLALPHFLHEEVTIACARAGRHILAEKPLCTSVAAGARIAAAVRDSGVVFGIQHNYTCFPHHAAIRQAIKSGLIGNPYLVRYESFFSGRHWPGAAGYDPDWRVKLNRGGGGALIDPGYHSVYLSELFMGQPVERVVARAIATEAGEVDDLALTILSHEGGGVSSVQIGWSVHGGSPAVVEVHGSAGSLRIGDQNVIEHHDADKEEWTPYFVPEGRLSFVDTYAGMLDEFAAAVVGGRQPTYGLDAALHTLAIIMAAYESERVGEAVSVRSLERQMN